MEPGFLGSFPLFHCLFRGRVWFGGWDGHGLLRCRSGPEGGLLT